jgi:uridine phosphorylase
MNKHEKVAKKRLKNSWGSLPMESMVVRHTGIGISSAVLAVLDQLRTNDSNAERRHRETLEALADIRKKGK